jgi:hypothetical protein
MEMDVLVQPAPAPQRTFDRVRAHTPSQLNNRIDQAMMKRIWFFARQPTDILSRRIEQLDREWDIERIAETSAAGISIAGVILSATRGRRWLVLPTLVLSLLLQHSVTRKGMPVLLLRQLGVRTRREIEAEKYAMKMLRGDFDAIKTVSEDAHKAIEAVRLTRM